MEWHTYVAQTHGFKGSNPFLDTNRKSLTAIFITSAIKIESYIATCIYACVAYEVGARG